MTGSPLEKLSFRVYIHENADVKAAGLFWLEATGAKPEQFLAPTLKRHNPEDRAEERGRDLSRLPP